MGLKFHAVDNSLPVNLGKVMIIKKKGSVTKFMAISPIVQQHQQSIVQQSNTPEQLTFNKEFGDAAYELLGAKYPRLLPYVVTFKVLEGEQDESNEVSVGTFIISRNADIEYIPVVMHDGSIVSCEMLYNKTEDSFVPLIPKEVKAIVDDNRTSEHTLVKNPSVENTQDVYRNMFRPPISSRPTLASDSGIIESLPASAKKALSNYFENNPKVLAKVASFYPVEVLAAKLAPGKPVEKIAAEEEVAQYNYLDKVVRLEDLTKEAAEMLSDEAKEQLLEVGYAITAEITEPAGVIPDAEMLESAEKVFNAQEFDPKTAMWGTGNLIMREGIHPRLVPCIISGREVLIQDRTFTMTNSLLVSDFKEGITDEDLVTIGGYERVSAQAFQSFTEGAGTTRVSVAYPTRGSGYKLSEIEAMSGLTRDIGGVLWVGASGQDEVCFTPDIKVGTISEGLLPSIFPRKCYARPVHYHSGRGYFETIQELTTFLMKTATPLRLHYDGPHINLTDRSLDKTAQFTNEADFVKHLVTQYNFDKTASATLLKHKKVHLIKKAFDHGQGTSEQSLSTMWGTAPQQGQPQMQGQAPMEEEQPTEVIDESLLEDTADLGDPEMMDTGMIASLAHTDDIKSLLIDSNQDFKGTVTEVGKTILLFSIKKTEVEEQYGREDYSAVLHKLRNVFQALGHLTFDVTEFVNNRSYKADEI